MHKERLRRIFNLWGRWGISLFIYYIQLSSSPQFYETVLIDMVDGYIVNSPSFLSIKFIPSIIIV